MPRTAPSLLAVLAVLAAAPALAGEHAMPKAQAPSPVFERLKELAGTWEGTARQPGSDTTFPTRATYSVVSAGSAVMLVTDPGGKYEMITMFHRDGDAVLATHYCAGQNQPRMRYVPGPDPKRLAFDFMDGTNLRDYPQRMQSVVLLLTDADHHVQEWTSSGGKAEDHMVFELARKK
jgi:hypothetical protein